MYYRTKEAGRQDQGFWRCRKKLEANGRKERILNANTNAKRKDALSIKTKEQRKRQMLTLAETVIEKLVDQAEEVKEGGRQHLEELVLQTVMEPGKQGMETLLNHEAREETSQVCPEGKCGHRLHLVSSRERQVLTLMGRIRISRAYDHCEEEKLGPSCAGKIPFEIDWGLCRSQASPEVQRLLAKLSARLRPHGSGGNSGRGGPADPADGRSLCGPRRSAGSARALRANRQRMRSPVFRAQGMHLGRGVADAAWKTVVSTSATRSGMRWTPDGLAAILAFRTAVLKPGVSSVLASMPQGSVCKLRMSP